MISLRFLLILSVHQNLLRAALVTRDLKIVSSAHQTFELRGDEFDPAEVWYKTKRVIAACLDIGRTQAREIAGVAILAPPNQIVTWAEQEGEIVARGFVSDTEAANTRDAQNVAGNLSAWLEWNLTGVLPDANTNDFGKTRARAPFDAELPVVAVWHERDASDFVSDERVSEADRAVMNAARVGWGYFAT
jgi:hypothetical protein